MSSRDASLWKEAVNDEMDSILGNQTWELAELPKGVKSIGSKWVFKMKLILDGSIFAFKARLVSKCYKQREGLDYFDTYASDARISSIRTLIVVSAIKCLYIHQMDVKTAFLNGYLHYEVYMKRPEGFVIQDTTINGISETKSYLSLNFKMKDLGEVDIILGIKVKRTNDQISLSQSHYIEKILTKFQQLHKKESNLPFEPSVHLEKNSGRAVTQLEYASVIGCLMYATYCTRPDIAFDVSKLSQYTSNPSLEHWRAVSKVLGYLKRTNALNLTYTSYPGVLEGGAVSWASKKQTCISHSTMEAEFIALAAAGKEAEWMRDLLLDIQLWPGPMPSIPMYCDSEATLSKAYNSVYNGKSRQILLRRNYVRQVIENGTISVVYVKSCRNLADPLTKPLTRDLVSVATRDMGLKP
uniref:Reverse transcriptase Ty1/copia-type domain-containing protein n=1 Tax=Tanacetum cinerariifolium TaxID=118510 RepID=A0A699GQB0_TANCI|nr:hypothetical protein [Tanacetum cinerariifolium]GEV80623.1 hypothetical protein [Tanacetum cinerariifolium]